MPAEIPPESDAAPFPRGALGPTATQSILWLSAVGWCVAVLLIHDSSWAVSGGFGLLAGVLVMFSVGSSARSRTPEGLGLAHTDMLIAVGAPFLVALASTESLRGGPPLGLGWGFAACAGATVGLAAGYSFLECRASL